MKPHRFPGPILSWMVCRGLWMVLGLCAGFIGRTEDLRVRWMAGAEPLEFGESRLTNAAGQRLTFTRWDVILSGIAFHRPGAGWMVRSNWVAIFEGGGEPVGAPFDGLPRGTYDRVRFDIGLSPAMNQRDAATWAAEHPLNPARSGLHWGWAGGWVFAAIEGHWTGVTGRDEGFSFHLATDTHRMTVERGLTFVAGAGAGLEVVFDAARFVEGTGGFVLDDESVSTHSREGDPLAGRLAARLVEATSVRVVPKRGLAEGRSSPLVGSGTAPDARPYRLKIPETFPRPNLPLDNPLTEEGVALGQRLFFDPILSLGERQSCATCHDPAKAFTDGRAVSIGVEGRSGTRSSMPLFNLAWRSTFFWDGRVRTLREQVLEPITNPEEMAETLTTVLAKLGADSGDTGYPEAFRRAFGSREVTADRLARALEQYLLVQVSGDSRFDRALRGEATLSALEARGFELFRTEFDPSRGLRGADCFHCHGGSLFQSQRFGNNGLATHSGDAGRGGVTGRAADLGLFAVPSLRNVALTAPYMHDGRFRTLEEAVAHYCTGVNPSPTLDPNLAKHPDGGLRLDAGDQRALVAFLHTLTEADAVSSAVTVESVEPWLDDGD
jgi:cytochrome c peroxidase